MDVTLRLETIILDIERTREPILIVGELLIPDPDSNYFTFQVI